jgi:glycogen debranching enzyme
LSLGNDIQSQEWIDALKLACNYILRHIVAGLFWEDPRHCGATRYMAYATYWKDSHLPGRQNVAYPVAYTLVQAQSVAALRALVHIEERLELGFSIELLKRYASDIVDSIWTKLWDEATDYPLLALDHEASIPGISSDALHMLAYLDPTDIPKRNLEAIVKAARRLETPYGYRSYAPSQVDYSAGAYHLGSIWPYEQFFIAKAAVKNQLPDVLDCSVRVTQAILKHGFAELMVWDGKRLSSGGCDLQLWSAAYPEAVYLLLTEATEG